MLGAQSGVMNDIPAGQRAVGYPAIEEKEQYQVWAATIRLPEMRKKLLELERKLAALTASESKAKDAA